MSRYWAILFLCSWPGAAFGHHDDVVSTQHLVESLLDQQEALDGLTLHFVERHWYGSGDRNAPNGGPLPEHRVYVAECKYVCMGRKYRLERTYTEVHDNLSSRQDDREIMIWNGAEARTIQEYRPEGDRSVQIDLAPPFYHRMQPHLSWLGSWVLQARDRLSYQDLLQGEGVQGPELMPDGRTRWRCPFPGLPTTRVFILAEPVDGNIELSEVEFRSYSESGFGEEDLLVLHRLAFGQVREELGPLAHTFAFTQSHRRANPEDEFWSMTTIVLKSVEREETTGAKFGGGLGPGTKVVDNRYRIGYRLGRDTINMDGRLVETHEPLHGEVGHNLEWWVQHGKLGPVLDPNTGAFADLDGEDESSRANRSRLLSLGMLIGTLLLLSFILLIKKRSA